MCVMTACTYAHTCASTTTCAQVQSTPLHTYSLSICFISAYLSHWHEAKMHASTPFFYACHSIIAPAMPHTITPTVLTYIGMYKEVTGRFYALKIDQDASYHALDKWLQRK